MPRISLLLLLAMTLLTPARASAGSGWIARFVWSPEYCSKFADSHEAQCQQPVGFVLQELVRVVDGREVVGCNSTRPFPEYLIDQMAMFTRNRLQTLRIWERYGRCSGLTEIDYAAYAAYVDRRMSWPTGYQPDRVTRVDSAAGLIAALAEENPQLPADALALQCQRRHLETVTVCLDDAFEASTSACPLRSNCGERLLLRASR